MGLGRHRLGEEPEEREKQEGEEGQGEEGQEERQEVAGAYFHPRRR